MTDPTLPAEQLDRMQCIDAEDPESGHARFVNHSLRRDNCALAYADYGILGRLVMWAPLLIGTGLLLARGRPLS